MKIYSAPRQAGKTRLALNRASLFADDGYDVYFVSPTVMMTDFAKKMAEDELGKEKARKIKFIPFYKILKKETLSGVNKRRGNKIIFDDIDISLSTLVSNAFGGNSSVEFATATDDWRK